MQTILDILARPELQNLIIMGVVFLVGLAKKMEWAKKWKAGVGLDSVVVGVEASWDSFVRERKKANADGKLTPEERKEAQRIAIETAIEYAKNQGMDLVKFYGKELLPIIINKVVAKSKAGKAVSKVMAPLLGPELPLG